MYYDNLDWRVSECDYKIAYRPGEGEPEVWEFTMTLEDAYERLDDLRTLPNYRDFMLFRWVGENDRWEEIQINRSDFLLCKMDAAIEKLERRVEELSEMVQNLNRALGSYRS